MVEPAGWLRPPRGIKNSRAQPSPLLSSESRGRGARVAAQAGVFGDVPAGETWSGYPARPHRQSLRASAALLRLADIIKKLEKLVERE